MSIAAVVGRGYGPAASIAFVVTRGYSIGSTPPSPPPPPAFDPNGVQGSGGGPPRKRRPTLHLDERYRPEIVDPRAYAVPRKPAVARAPEADLPTAVVEPDLPPLPVVARMPDDIAARVEASIAAVERKRVLAEMAADDEEAMMAILAAWAKQETGHG